MVSEAITVPAKHIFLDVVDYSRERSVEAQSYIIAFLNKIVLLSLTKNLISEDQRLLLPTGDGICISLLNVVTPYDIHIKLALSIIKYIRHFEGHDVDEINEKSADKEVVTFVHVRNDEEYLSRIRMREFEVRIGIDANIDNVVTDINGRQNIAGAGINMAQRIMGLADGSQILVSQNVFNELRHREKYIRSFRDLPSTMVKHGTYVKPYQFISEGCEGLNKDRPKAFEVTQQQPKTLTKIAAYYFAHSIQHREFLQERFRAGDDAYPAEAFLWLLARASLQQSAATTETEKIHFAQYGRIKEPINELYERIDSTYFTLLWAIEEYILLNVLDGYTNFFEGNMEYRFLNQEGAKKLKQEWPQIWEELALKDFNKTE
jgi:hypothetical protein